MQETKPEKKPEYFPKTRASYLTVSAVSIILHDGSVPLVDRGGPK